MRVRACVRVCVCGDLRRSTTPYDPSYVPDVHKEYKEDLKGLPSGSDRAASGNRTWCLSCEGITAARLRVPLPPGS